MRRREKLSHDERMRRLRLGDLRRLAHYRSHGPILSDDDAGREYLFELLLPISAGPYEAIRRPGMVNLWGPTERMFQEIERWAPWMTHTEADALIDEINQMPLWQRKIKAGPLGKRLNVTYSEREELRLWTIAQCEFGPKAMAELRKHKRRKRMRLLRQRRGARPQAASISKARPWIAAGFNTRRTWERHGKPNVATSCQVNLISTEHETATPHHPPLSRVAERTATNKTEITPQPPQKAETSEMDMTCVLRARSCDTTPEQNSNGSDLRGMPADLSKFYPPVPEYPWLNPAPPRLAKAS